MNDSRQGARRYSGTLRQLNDQWVVVQSGSGGSTYYLPRRTVSCINIIRPTTPPTGYTSPRGTVCPPPGVLTPAAPIYPAPPSVSVPEAKPIDPAAFPPAAAVDPGNPSTPLPINPEAAPSTSYAPVPVAATQTLAPAAIAAPQPAPQLMYSAKLKWIEITGDGDETTLCAPALATTSGRVASIAVGEFRVYLKIEASGQKSHPFLIYASSTASGEPRIVAVGSGESIRLPWPCESGKSRWLDIQVQTINPLCAVPPDTDQQTSEYSDRTIEGDPFAPIETGPEYRENAGVQRAAFEDTFEETSVLCVYAVGDLVRKAGVPTGAGGDRVFPAKLDFQPLIDDIQAHVAPKSWRAAGGDGAISAFPSGLSLVVQNSKEVQQGVAQYLKQRRDAKNAPPRPLGLEGPSNAPTLIPQAEAR